jgi:hypothetical protein
MLVIRSFKHRGLKNPAHTGRIVRASLQMNYDLAQIRNRAEQIEVARLKHAP